MIPKLRQKSDLSSRHFFKFKLLFFFFINLQHLARLSQSHASVVARICLRCDGQAGHCTGEVGVAHLVGALQWLGGANNCLMTLYQLKDTINMVFFLKCFQYWIIDDVLADLCSGLLLFKVCVCTVKVCYPISPNLETCSKQVLFQLEEEKNSE